MTNMQTAAEERIPVTIEGEANLPLDTPQIVVTTDGLLDRWLRAPADWWKKARKTPPGAEAALHDDDFFTQAVGSDATFGKTADIPITRPASTPAIAMLKTFAPSARMPPS